MNTQFRIIAACLTLSIVCIILSLFLTSSPLLQNVFLSLLTGLIISAIIASIFYFQERKKISHEISKKFLLGYEHLKQQNNLLKKHLQQFSEQKEKSFIESIINFEEAKKSANSIKEILRNYVIDELEENYSQYFIHNLLIDTNMKFNVYVHLFELSGFLRRFEYFWEDCQNISQHLFTLNNTNPSNKKNRTQNNKIKKLVAFNLKFSNDFFVETEEEIQKIKNTLKILEKTVDLNNADLTILAIRTATSNSFITSMNPTKSRRQHIEFILRKKG